MTDIAAKADTPTPGKTPKYVMRLPASPFAKLMRLIEQADDSHGYVVDVMAKADKARLALNQATAEHTRMLADFEQGQVVRETSDTVNGNIRIVRPPDQQRLDNSARELAALKGEYDRQVANREALAENWHSFAQPIVRIETYLRALPSDVRVVAVASTVRTRKASEAEVSRQREVVASLKAELADAIAAPIPSTEAKEAARNLVERLADQGAPKLYDLAYQAFRIEFPVVRRDVETHGRSGEGVVVASRGSTNSVDPLALLAWVDPEKMLAALYRDIDEIADDKTALDAATRAFREDELEKKILAVEREGEAVVEQALVAGLKVTRRIDADPRAMLGIDGPALEAF